MLDQDTARALLTVADETGARVALVGDRHQLPAVGRGGVLDLAARWAHPTGRARPRRRAPVHRPRVRRPQPADAHRPSRPGRGVRRAASRAARSSSTPARSSAPQAARRRRQPPRRATLVIADTREQVAALNAAIRDHRRHRRASPIDQATRCRHRRAASGSGSGTGSRPAATTATSASPTARPGPSPPSTHDGSLTVAGPSAGDGASASRPATSREHVELAYATTVYGAQGETVDRAHLVARRAHRRRVGLRRR